MGASTVVREPPLANQLDVPFSKPPFSSSSTLASADDNSARLKGTASPKESKIQSLYM
jgi:hypothetical protein